MSAVQINVFDEMFKTNMKKLINECLNEYFSNQAKGEEWVHGEKALAEALGYKTCVAISRMMNEGKFKGCYARAGRRISFNVTEIRKRLNK